MSNRAGFTLVEMVIVVTVIAVVAGMAIVAYGQVGAVTDEQAIKAECATVRSACLRFRIDTGQAPRFIAELIQEPSAWWWADPSGRPGPWDNATRLGWNGPYLVAEKMSDYPTTPTTAHPVIETEEIRMLPAGSTASIASTSAQTLAILTSEYASYPQNGNLPGTTPQHWTSHFQLDSSSSEVLVTFVKEPKTDPTVVFCLSTGLKPTP